MKKLSFLFALIFVLSLFGAKPAQAQFFGVSWDSGFQVLNLDPTNNASITITYYNTDGSLATSFTNPVTDTVLADQANNYYPIHALAGFQGSVQISSNMPIAVVTNVIVKTTNAGKASYIGAPAGAPAVKFPLIMKGNAYQTSLVTVQNVGGSSAQVTFNFIPESATYPSITPVVQNLNAGGSYTLDLSTHSAFSGISKWVGSVVASVTDTANDLIVGVVNTVKTKDAVGYGVATYNGFTGAGSPTVMLPLIQENNNYNRTGVTCQNVGSAPTDITITYIPGPGIAAKAPQTVTGVAVNGAAVFVQDYLGTTKFVGSALVSSSPAQNLVCIVNQTRPITGNYSTYEGFNGDPAAATDTVVYPLVQSRNGSITKGWIYSSLTVASVDGTDVTVTCDFKPAAGFPDPADRTLTGASVVFLLSDIYGTGAQYLGGAVCTATGGKAIVGILNESRQSTPATPRDVLATYDGFNN